MRRLLSTFVLSGALVACGISQQQEMQLGQQASMDINRQLPMVNDPTVNSYVTQLGNRIASHGQRGLNYRFFVVNSDVVNAFAVPGGYVYVNRGLIERAGNMSELAGVLAHEISHVELRHSVQQMEKAQGANAAVTLGSVLLGQPSSVGAAAINVAGTAVFAKFSRDDENEADANAIPLMIATGINPNGLTTMFQRLISLQKSQPNAVTQFFSTHPASQERVNQTQARINQVPAAQRRNLTTDATQFHTIQSRLRSMSPAPRSNQ
ncbi:MAG TPA: M48 family metallopeptidase [Longimicrobiales bacterium]|nr:M48 family metallopeptidase [Longimicrobiales bacterium]